MNFYLFLEIWVKNIGKNINLNLSGEYSQKLLDHAKKSTEGTGDLIGNKIADKNKRVPENTQQNHSDPVINDHDKEIPKQR